MGAITGVLGPVTALGPKLLQELNEGRPVRSTFGRQDTAFAWTAGAPRTFANFVSTAQAESMKFGVVINGAGGNDAAKVAEKGAKPDVCSLTSTDVTLAKYAGLCSFTLENELTTAGLVQAVSYTIIAKALVAFEKDLAAGIIAGKGSTVDGAGSWATGVLKAIGAVVAHGGNPSVLAMAPEDFAEAITTPSNLMFSGTDVVPSFLGLRLHISAGLTAGTAVVLDPAAVMAVEHVDSPIVIVDPYSSADTNEIRVVGDLVAGFVVVNPAAVVTVTKGTAS